MERITVPSSTSCRSKPRSRVLRCRLLVLVTFATLIALGWTATASAASASIVHRGSSERKQIALTFDDNTNTRTLYSPRE